MVFYSKQMQMKLLFWLVILLVALLAGAVAGTCSDSPLFVEVWATVDDGGEGNIVGCVNFSEELCGISGGNPLAFLLTLEVSEGWRMVSMMESDRLGGMAVTVSLSQDGRRAEVLVDGCPAVADGIKSLPVVRLVGESSAPCRLAVSPGRRGDTAIYYLNRDGEIQTIPIYTAESPDTVTTETAETDQQDPDEDEIDEGKTDEQKDVTPEEPPAFVFLGCRETPAGGEGFAVQFLFCGDERYTPVICFSGGGGVFLSVDGMDRETLGKENEDKIPKEKALYACTFRGLPANGEILFLVGTPEGIRNVVYQDGKFCGYS